MPNSKQIDLTTANALEKDALEIALGVLRSGTDYGDFLNCWLQDYGKQVLSPNPPAPLLAEEWDEDLSLVDGPVYVN